MIDGSDRAVRVVFERWRASSAEHARAYEHVRKARADALSLAGDPRLLALRHEAVTRAMFGKRPVRTKRMVALAVVALAGAPLAALGLSHWAPSAPERPVEESFRTEIGQQATVTLPDGSRVTLDTDSQLHIAFTEGERRVMLRGQGWFQLAASPRPFVIAAGGRSMTADAGTFDVRTDPGMVRVLAVQGRMAVRVDGADAASSVALDPGHMLAARENGISIQRPEESSPLTSWRSGLLQFDDVKLADAVGELNRYRRQPIRVADGRAAAVRVSGSFRTAESPAFTDALAIGFPVRVKQDGSAGIVIASR